MREPTCGVRLVHVEHNAGTGDARDAAEGSLELQAGGGIGREAARRAGLQRLYYPFADEYRSLPPDVPLLQALAQQTGGKVAPTAAEIFAAGDDRGHTQRSLWPWLAAAALLFYLVDIALRRGALGFAQRMLRRQTAR